jgi:hypothetical protein
VSYIRPLSKPEALCIWGDRMGIHISHNVKRTMKYFVISTLLVLVGGCTAEATKAPEQPCYGTFPATGHACSGDWSHIETISTTGPADTQSTTTTDLCVCPQYTACFTFDYDGQAVIACALTAGN